MRQFFITLVIGILCLATGLAVGVVFAPQIKGSQPVLQLQSMAAKASLVKADENSAFESYDYPTIKWRAKPLSDAQGAIAQLWTRFERNGEGPSGKLSYKLTIFKAPERRQCEVQLLDDPGFKLLQFDASDFHQIPGAPDIAEARDSITCNETEYQHVRDYSIK